MLSLERLRVLHAVTAAGSVVGAAAALHVTTSAVSQQLARLEREVGQRLLERRGRGVRLTEAGALLADRAGELLAHVERVESDLAGHRGTVDGAVAVAGFATAVRGLLTGALGELRSRHPALRVSLSEREPHEAVPALRRGHLDLVVAQDWPDDPLAVPSDLSRRHLLDDPFDLAVSPDHPSAGRDRVGVDDLVDLEWISWSSGQICHDWLVRSLSTDVRGPRVAHTASEHATQLALVTAGLGAALIPRLGRDPVPEGVRFVPIDPAPTRRVFALWRTSSAPRPAVRAVLDALAPRGAPTGHR
ncbi:LysR family transcriptional regulator [Pseudonocardia humida]|uniref:LysR family transcriptional regulator n=1 Tax=Pseudonocardia humida TaxID=2800819 RepID=A0ABT1AC32_9PSEU|nr:LysR family transcriptional regulator [Pseudonocardia humida]MCO1660500.1 LysR family transcriptional regulator [Pseudonocardia humida]